MCGFFAICFEREQPNLGEILVQAGRRLSYRGYDSVGAVAISSDGRYDLRKDVGGIEEVATKLRLRELSGSRGILQLRWATFGAPSKVNAQPHLDCKSKLVGAHNGNVVNACSLRWELLRQGHKVRGDNDGEVLVHIVERWFQKSGDLGQAVLRAAQDLRGDYAYCIALIDDDNIYACKQGSSLFLGKGDGFVCVSSDFVSILDLTRQIMMLKDGEFVRFNARSYELYNMKGKLIHRRLQECPLPIENVSKGKYPHFMLKEIEESQQKAKELLHLLPEYPGVGEFVNSMSEARNLYIVGAGTSYHAGLLGSYYLNKIARRVALPCFAAEFVERFGSGLKRDDLLICVSQSGETKDVKNAVDFCERRRVKVASIVNVLGSSLALRSKLLIPIACDLEMSVPATKTFVNQAITFLYLSILLAKRSPIKLNELAPLPGLLGQAIKIARRPAEELAEILYKREDFYSVGYGLSYPIALEGALKIKEVLYAHCEGMYSAEFKHGPLSIVTPGYPVIFTTTLRDRDMTLSHINEVRCRQGFVITIACEDEELRAQSDFYIPVPECNYFLFPIVAVIPLQLLAYELSVRRGLDPDFPRNISKTLTVD